MAWPGGPRLVQLTTPCPPTFACSVRSASMLSTSGGARAGGVARRTSRHGKGSKVSRVNGCLLPRSSIRGRLTASASNTRGGSRMRESRPYGSERGAFSNGRPYRDRTDGHRRSPGDLELFLSSRVNAGRRSGQGHVQQIVVEVEPSGDSQAPFRLRIDASSIVMLRQNGYFPSPDSPSLGP